MTINMNRCHTDHHKFNQKVVSTHAYNGKIMQFCRGEHRNETEKDVVKKRKNRRWKNKKNMYMIK